MSNYRTFKWDDDSYRVVKDAIEYMRLLLGNYMVNGLPVEASNSRCLELICAEWLSGRMMDGPLQLEGIIEDHSCYVCGSRENIQVHHIKFRSQGGTDEKENLMRLCAECHQKIHLQKLQILQ